MIGSAAYRHRDRAGGFERLAQRGMEAVFPPRVDGSAAAFRAENNVEEEVVEGCAQD